MTIFSKKINLEEAVNMAQKTKQAGQKIVLVGGVFDILHYGHIRFLEQAKKKGNILIIALEPDKKIKELKGETRPINNELIRSRVLAAISVVDYILLLPKFTVNQQYEDMVKKIKPDVIAVTQGDPFIKEKKHQAESVGGKLVIFPKIPTLSTSQLAKLLAIE